MLPSSSTRHPFLFDHSESVLVPIGANSPKYKVCAQHDKDDIAAFLTPSNLTVTFSSLFEWAETKLSALLECIQPHHLSTISMRAMDAEVTEPPIDLAFHNLYLYDSAAHCVRLQGISGVVRPGMFVGLIGAADAGISALLSVLSGRVKGGMFEGQILLNGQPKVKHLDKVMGFVRKESKNLPLLTVEETLYFSAKLRLKSLPEKILRFLVKVAMKQLGIENIANSIIGDGNIRGISGGERRRVMFGCELVAGHSIILADQPTDGLDSRSAVSILRNYKFQVRAGRSMMTSVSQASPKIFELFDFLLILSKGAQIYFGPRERVEHYFNYIGFRRPSSMPIVEYLEDLSGNPHTYWKGDPRDMESYITRLRLEGDDQIERKDEEAPDGSGPLYRWIATPFGKQQAKVESQPTLSVKVSPNEENSVVSIDAAPSSESIDLRSLGNGLSSFASSSTLGTGLPSSGSYMGHARPSKIVNPFVSINGKKTSVPKPTSGTTAPSPIDETNSKEMSSNSDEFTAGDSSRLCELAWQYITSRWSESGWNREVGYELLRTMTHAPKFLVPDETQQGPVFNSTYSQQLRMCLWRANLLIYRNTGFWLWNWLKFLMMGLMIGSSFFSLPLNTRVDARARLACFYFVITYIGNSAIQMISVQIAQRQLFHNEMRSRYYHGFPFFLSTSLALVPLAVAETLCLGIPIYWLMGLRPAVERFLYWLVCLFLCNLNSRAWVLLLSSFLPNQVIANILAPLFNLMFSAFAGYLNPKNAIPKPWIWAYYTSYYSYALDGLGRNELEGYGPPDPQTLEEEDVISTNRTVGNAELTQYNLNGDKGTDLLILMIFFIGFNTIAMLAYSYLDFSSSEMGAKPSFKSTDPAALAKESTRRMTIALKRDSRSQFSLRNLHDLAQTDVELEEYKGKEESEPRNQPKSYLSPCMAWSAIGYSVPLRAKTGMATSLGVAIKKFFSRDPVLIENQKPPSDAPAEMEDQKALLHSVCGYVCKGNMVALMGTSGGGKSTLLEVLFNKKSGGEIDGISEISFNGRRVNLRNSADLKTLTDRMGFVDQFDVFNGNSTVRETIEMSGRLRLPPSTAASEIRKKTNELLELFGLDEVADSLIASEASAPLSSEVRKKVSIAVELIAEPILLALDEPTTGASYDAALSLCRLLKKLSDSICIIVTIHQPSPQILDMFDTLILLRTGGYLVYVGPVPEVAHYLNSLKTADPSLPITEFDPLEPSANVSYYALSTVKVVSDAFPGFKWGNYFYLSQWGKQLIQKLQEMNHKVENYVNISLEDDLDSHVKGRGEERGPGLQKGWASILPSFNIPDPRQLYFEIVELTRRSYLSLVRNKRNWQSRFFTAFMFASITGTLFYQLPVTAVGLQTRVSLIYFACRWSLFSGNLKMPGIFAVRPLFFRETKSNMYSAWTFYLSQTIADTPFILVENLLYVSIVYWVSGLSAADSGLHFIMFYITFLLCRTSSIAFIEVVGHSSGNIEMAQSTQATANFILMLFCGYFVQPDAIPPYWKWLFYVSYYNYPYSYLTQSELATITEATCAPRSVIEVPFSSYSTCPINSPPVENDEGIYVTLKCPIQCGAEELATYDLSADPGSIQMNFWITVAFALGLRLLAAATLRYINFVKR